MKILQIIYSLTSGGAERLVLDLSNEFSNYNEVHILTLLDEEIGDNSFYKSLLSKNVHYHCAKEIRGFNMKKFFNINKMVREIAPDIIHFHGKGISNYFLPSILFYRKPKYIETLHNKADIIFDNWYSFIILSLFKLDLIKMVSISDENKLGYEQLIKKDSSTLIYNGRSKPVVSPLFNQVKYEINALKKDENDIVFIHVGRCSREKNQKMLIEVFNQIYMKQVGFILLIFGEGFDSEMGKEIKDLANENIHFLGTTLNIIDYFMCSDAFCLSSKYEGMPITLIEAFGTECIPICTPTSGSSDVIIDGQNGFISEGFSKESYLSAVERYINGKNDFNKNILKQTYLDVFSMEKCVQLYYNLYEKVLMQK